MKKRITALAACVALGLVLGLALQHKIVAPPHDNSAPQPEPSVKAPVAQAPVTNPMPTPSQFKRPKSPPGKGWGLYVTDENMQESPVTDEQARAMEKLSTTTRLEIMAAMAKVADFDMIAPNNCTVKVALPKDQATRLRDDYVAKLGEIVGPEWMSKEASVGPLRRLEALLNNFGLDPVVFEFTGEGETLADSRRFADATLFIQSNGQYVGVGGTQDHFGMLEKYGAIAERAFALSRAGKS